MSNAQVPRKPAATPQPGATAAKGPEKAAGTGARPAAKAASGKPAPPARAEAKPASADKAAAKPPTKPPAKPAANATKAATAPAGKPAASPADARPQASAKTGAPAKRRRLKLPPATRRIGSENIFWGAVAVSIVLHAALLALQFSMPDAKLQRQRDKGLDIVLVNAKHARAPKDPQALAQANLDGGGNSKQKAMPTTPVPPQDQSKEGDTLLEAQRRVEQLEERQRELLARNKGLSQTQVAQAKPKESPNAPRSSGLDLVESARAIAKQEAAIDKQLQEYAQRPRKAFVGARTTEYRFAQYVEDWRQKIERVGTLNFPQDRKGKIYGNLMVAVEIRSDGTIASAEVKRSSGNRTLDDAAMRILQLSSPFAPFPPNLKKDVDVLVIARTWNFSKEGDALEARDSK
ncbi:TonB family protein [Niveibacterium sp. 24ML]|uniref:energy transducer TonB n=1 Tax=Niveibacterium sp. 24ML TaxID=2985512 RepID=UPI00226EAA31|nr:TonB family protein [Niveibacterium sp. 24ML]MCX9155463.1 TonB family protein [Niveibacterium sp. 24ML]